MPPRATIRHPTEENFAWLGRASALIECWNPFKSSLFGLEISKLNGIDARQGDQGFRGIMILLNQARSDLQMRTIGPINVALGQGMVFDYFEEVRRTIELASQEVWFIDQYLDADFVARYLPHVRAGVSIRLLTSTKRLSSLLAAVDLFAQQNQIEISVRSTSGVHDRYVIIDKASCFQSGASFKDGARSAPTTLTQITDAFAAVLQTYEGLWADATVERPSP